MKREHFVDNLRAISILCVIVGHPIRDTLLAFYPQYASPIIDYCGYVAFWGVEAFFVISAYLIATRCSINNLVDYYFRRLKRTLPPFFVASILTLFLFYAVGLNVDIFEYIKEVFLIKNVFSNQINYLPCSWSLAVEEFFYFMALLILVPLIIKRNKNIGIYIILLWLIKVLSVNYFGLNHAQYWRTGVLFRLPDIGLIFLFFYLGLFSYVKKFPPIVNLTFGSIIAIYSFLLYWNPNSIYFGAFTGLNMISIIGIFSLMYVFCNRPNPLGVYFASRSYSLYLLSGSIYLVLDKSFGEVLSLLLYFLLSELFYQLVDARYGHFSKKSSRIASRVKNVLNTKSV